MRNEQNYIKHVTLSGYKSIKNLECDFLPGLNIIIGDNGSGKSNFFEFVYKCMRKEYANFIDINAEISYADENKKEKLLTWSKTSSSKSSEPETIDKFIHRAPDEAIKTGENQHYSLPEYVSFSLPELYIMDKEFSLIYDTHIKAIVLNEESGELPHFLDLTFNLSASFYLKDIDVKDDGKVYEKLSALVDFSYYSFKKGIQQYTPVEDFRLSESLRVVKLDTRNLEIRNIVFEYKLNGEWYSWKSLSDGTKRMLFIIASLSEVYLFLGEENSKRVEETFKPPIIFIEEPELGIHPHQLHMILLFLKECAESQQIFLATHSPQVLDALPAEELERIIIAEITPEKGTTFRHMNQNEVHDAGIYLKETGLLSDYWRFSDFQRTVN